jgi:hydroxyacylglutathione hydrolase
MKIECVPLGPFETNCYLLTDDAGKSCAVVDAPPGSGEHILAEIAERGLKLESLLITHGHWDHMADAHLFQKAGAKVYAHKADEVLIEQVERVAPRYRAMIPWLSDSAFTSCKVDAWLDEGDTVDAVGLTFEVRHVPGHCPGSILFYSTQEKLAFVGDAIFAGSVGRTDLPGGDWPTLLKAIREKIYTLPKDTVLFTGHGEDTTVGAEFISNQYARPLNPLG